MKVVFDSNILIDALRGIPEAQECIIQYQGVISMITYIEVLSGAQDHHLEMIKDLLSQFQQVSISEEVALEAVRIRKARRLKLPDAIIYATAKVNEISLLTRDTKDFTEDLDDVITPYTL